MPLHVVEVFKYEGEKKIKIPVYVSKIKTGFPSPAEEDYTDKKLDLNEYLIKHEDATYFLRSRGNSMIGAGIHSGDILIVDRALEAKNNKVIIAALNGELTVKRIIIKKDRIFLETENPDYPTIEVTPETDFQVWGVVTSVIHSL